MKILFSIRSVLMIAGMLVASAASFGQVAIGVAINLEPPELPVYDQPVCPGDGYIWTPGYWAYDDDSGYYWVPGTWVLAPEPGFLWTPGYWAWGDGGYIFYQGYWGPVVGFYGGINYGFGYFGHGFEGGRWDRDHFFYNRAVANVNVNIIHNTYNTVVENRNVTRVSFNGGNGGINERPTRQEETAAHERHIGPVSAQTEHFQAAHGNQDLRASVNHGKPPVAATDKPAQFKGGGVVAAREGGAVHTNETRPRNNNNNAPRAETNNVPRAENNANRPNTIIHPRDIPAVERPAAPNTGNPNLDKKYQQQQQKLQQKQDQERQKLQARQEQDHQKAEQQRANDAARQQLEQRHQQQTQQLQQKHVQQQQRMQQHQQPPPQRPNNGGKPHPH